jgi:hypothetical protein
MDLGISAEPTTNAVELKYGTRSVWTQSVRGAPHGEWFRVLGDSDSNHGNRFDRTGLQAR